MKAKTKEKVKYWLDFDSSLKDDDNRLCANIWAEEMVALGFGGIETEAVVFLKLYATSKLTSAPSIRARAKLQEEDASFRGGKYMLRQNKLQKKWRKDLGYENN